MSTPRPVVNRWRRYGHDRWYVAHPDGVKLGRWDLATDEAHPASPHCPPVLVTVVARWKADRHPGDPSAIAPRDAGPGAAATVEPITPDPAAPSAPDGENVASALAGTPAPTEEKPGTSTRPKCSRPSRWWRGTPAPGGDDPAATHLHRILQGHPFPDHAVSTPATHMTKHGTAHDATPALAAPRNDTTSTVSGGRPGHGSLPLAAGTLVVGVPPTSGPHNRKGIGPRPPSSSRKIPCRTHGS